MGEIGENFLLAKISAYTVLHPKIDIGHVIIVLV